MRKQYVVVLSELERARLRTLIGQGSAPARALTRARILLKASQGEAGPGWSDRAIAAALEVHHTTDPERLSAQDVNMARKYRTEAIVDFLTAADSEMSIKDVIKGLHDSGRPHETYDNVAADLAYLAERKRIARLRRGVYSRRDRIYIPITQGSLEHSYIRLANYLGFFPADAVSPSNGNEVKGALLTLHFVGLPQPVETDIDGTHNFFRSRRCIREFFAYNQLQPGEKIAIEKQSEYEYEYHIRPAR